MLVEKFSVLFFLSLLEIMLRVGYLQALAKAAPAKGFAALTPLLKVGPYFTA